MTDMLVNMSVFGPASLVCLVSIVVLEIVSTLNLPRHSQSRITRRQGLELPGIGRRRREGLLRDEGLSCLA